jgi:basic membrane lipoprotein Med (substrate-binding protein (PBP1-ABC) superfamily)
MRLRAGRQIRERQGRSVRQHDRHDAGAWNDPVKGGELAKSQIDRGADIVYAAAGATGQGVLKAAADAGKFGIGVDSDQDNLFPGKVLTSMLKRVDVATYESFKAAKDGTWKAGVQVFGLKDRRRRLCAGRMEQERS